MAQPALLSDSTKRIISTILNGDEKPQFRLQFASLLKQMDLDFQVSDLAKLISDFLERNDRMIVKFFNKMAGLTDTNKYLDKITSIIVDSIGVIDSPTLKMLRNLSSFDYYCLDIFGINGAKHLKAVSYDNSPAPMEFTQTKSKTHKRALSGSQFAIETKNKFAALDNENDIGDAEIEDLSNLSIEDTRQEKSDSAPIETFHPFHIEFEGNWKLVAQPIAELCEPPPKIKFSGELLKVLPKNVADFRKIQDYLHKKNLKFTTLESQDRRPKKVVVRSVPINTPFEDFQEGFEAHGYSCIRAAMMKNRKTGQPMPLYLCDIAPHKDFDKIYDITTLGLLSITVKRQKQLNEHS